MRRQERVLVGLLARENIGTDLEHIGRVNIADRRIRNIDIVAGSVRIGPQDRMHVVRLRQGLAFHHGPLDNARVFHGDIRLSEDQDRQRDYSSDQESINIFWSSFLPFFSEIAPVFGSLF